MSGFKKQNPTKNDFGDNDSVQNIGGPGAVYLPPALPKSSLAWFSHSISSCNQTLNAIVERIIVSGGSISSATFCPPK